jgi:hypothetical protein
MLDERGQSDKDRIITHFDLLGSNSGLMKGTTPPWLIITSPKSLFNLHHDGRVSTISQCVVESELTPRRCEWRAVSVLVQYVASCYPGQHYQPTREFRRPNIPGRQQDRLWHIMNIVDHEPLTPSSRTRSTSANTLCIVASLQETVHTTNRELEAGLGRT